MAEKKSRAKASDLVGNIPTLKVEARSSNDEEEAAKADLAAEDRGAPTPAKSEARENAEVLIDHGVDPVTETTMDEDTAVAAKSDAGLEEDEEVHAESSDAEIADSRESFEVGLENAFEDKHSPLKLRGYSQPVFRDSAIRVGDVGGQVRYVRHQLAKAGAYRQPDLIDDRDNFDPKTEAAVMQFQKDEGLEATGEIDAATFAALVKVE